MASYNRVIVMGNLTRDPEVRYLPSGQAVCDLGVAVNERVKKDNEWVDQPTFLDVTFWEKQAETAGQYLRKGNPVLVEGKLRQESWNDKNTGEKRSKLKIIGDRLVRMGGKNDGAPGGAPRASGGYEGGAPAPRSGGYSGGGEGAPPPRSAPARAPQAAPPPPASYDDGSAGGDEDNLPF